MALQELWARRFGKTFAPNVSVTEILLPGNAYSFHATMIKVSQYTVGNTLILSRRPYNLK